MMDSLNAHTRHLAAFFGTTATCLSATLAVIGFMSPAVCAAAIADFRADPAQFGSECRATAHESRCAPANLRTVPIKPNTLGHRRDVLLS
jgi:hypothetical protein